MPVPALSATNLALSSSGLDLVRPLTFSLQPGERVALLGASGSGKSLTAAALTGTVPAGIRMTGSISFPAHSPAWPGARPAALVRQDPASSLNPLVPVGRQLMIPLRRARHSRAQARVAAAGMLRLAGLVDAARILPRYPGELSGGQLQRVCIALALACGSSILVADEPTTALDPVTRHKVLSTLRTWGTDGRALLFITHDLPAAAAACTRALVLAEGRIVEDASMAELLGNPRHPYTRRLVNAAKRTVLPTAAAA